jgi:ABC-2 type transport system permease protein
MITLSVLVIYLIFQGGVLLYIFGTLPVNYFSSIGLLVVFTFSIVAFTFLVSSIFNRNTYAYISVFLIYFLVFEAINVISEFLYKTTPFYLLDNAADIISKVYVNAGTGLFTSSLSINPAPMSEVLSSVLIIAIYGIISIAAALVIFQRKEAY